MFAPIANNVVYLVFKVFNEKLVEKRSVGDVLTGRKLGLLQVLEALSAPLRAIGIKVPSVGVGSYELAESKFGFVHMRHNQTFGPAEVWTGQGSGSGLGKFNTFKTVDGKP